MGGHAVMISRDGDDVWDRNFYHLHAFLPIAIPGEFTIPYHDHYKGIPDGHYRIWGQFKHDGKILTFPYEFYYTNPEEMLPCEKQVDPRSFMK